jgi:hypothetical protein
MGKELGISAIESDKGASDSDSSIQKCLVYSIGSNGDFSLQSALQHKLGNGNVCEVHIFDMRNFERLMPSDLNMHYYQWGLKNHEAIETSSNDPLQPGKE